MNTPVVIYSRFDRSYPNHTSHYSCYHLSLKKLKVEALIFLTRSQAINEYQASSMYIRHSWVQFRTRGVRVHLTVVFNGLWADVNEVNPGEQVSNTDSASEKKSQLTILSTEVCLRKIQKMHFPEMVELKN
jgi:hypothetical protein